MRNASFGSKHRALKSLFLRRVSLFAERAQKAGPSSGGVREHAPPPENF